VAVHVDAGLDEDANDLGLPVLDRQHERQLSASKVEPGPQECAHNLRHAGRHRFDERLVSLSGVSTKSVV